MWQGSAESVVDLHPTGYDWSAAWGTDGSVQVGQGGPGPGYPFQPHALMWTGTAASVVDLHPAGFDISTATDVDAGRQVGIASHYPDMGQHRDEAHLWSGSAASAVSLHPPGYVHSEARAIAGNYQAGLAYTPEFVSHAMLWKGTAASALDLHSLVAAADPYYQEFDYSTNAFDVTADGTVVGFAYDGITFAGVIWRRVDADFTADQHVDGGDLAVWQAAFGSDTTTPRTAGDANGDGKVDGTDFLLWQTRLSGASASAPLRPAPEPGSAALGLIVATALGALRSTRRQPNTSLPGDSVGS
jgi:hypothetical protein